MMSKFFKALEQAEQDRVRQGRAAPRTDDPAAVKPSPPPAELLWRAVEASPATPEASPTPPVLNPPPSRLRRPEPVLAPTEGSSVRIEEHLVALLVPDSYESEQYRALRLLVEQLKKAGSLSLVAVSSPGVGDGKTTTAINLAGALAQAPGVRVLLIDADLRLPSVGGALGLDGAGRPGLADAIVTPDVALEDVVCECPPFNLSVVPAGRCPTARYEVLAAPRLGKLLEEARRRYDYVVLDTPPLIPVPDCRLISKWVDGFLVVVSAHKTPRKLLEEALNVMEPSKVVGLVFNADNRPPWSYYGSYFAAHHPRAREKGN